MVVTSVLCWYAKTKSLSATVCPRGVVQSFDAVVVVAIPEFVVAIPEFVVVVHEFVVPRVPPYVHPVFVVCSGGVVVCVVFVVVGLFVLSG